LLLESTDKKVYYSALQNRREKDNVSEEIKRRYALKSEYIKAVEDIRSGRTQDGTATIGPLKRFLRAIVDEITGM
jgi:hypothetical protein